MSGSLGGAPIAGRRSFNDEDFDEEPGTLLVKRKRVRVLKNRYEGVDTSPPGEPTAPPTPTYDALSPQKRGAVDRLAVAVRMKQTQGLV